MRHLRGLALLASVGLIVTFGVAELGRLTVGEVAPVTSIYVDAIASATDATGSPDTSAFDLGATGLVLAFSGDRQGSSAYFDPYGGPEFRSNEGVVRTGYPAPGRPPEIRQVGWEGLDFFFDSGDCAMIRSEVLEESGLVEFDFDCGSRTDVRDGVTLGITGQAYLPRLGFDPELDPAVATIDVGGAVKATIESTNATWWIGGGIDPYVETPVIRSDDGSVTIQFGGDIEHLSVASLVFFDEYDTAVPISSCPVSLEFDESVGPSDEYMAFEFRCEEIETLDGPVTIEGSGRLLRHVEPLVPVS